MERVLMGVPISELTTTFLAKSQLTNNFGYLSAFTFLQRILFRHRPNFLYFSKSINFGGRHY